MEAHHTRAAVDGCRRNRLRRQNMSRLTFFLFLLTVVSGVSALIAGWVSDDPSWRIIFIFVFLFSWLLESFFDRHRQDYFLTMFAGLIIGAGLVFNTSTALVHFKYADALYTIDHCANACSLSLERVLESYISENIEQTEEGQ